jgi:hypothetical protein
MEFNTSFKWLRTSFRAFSDSRLKPARIVSTASRSRAAAAGKIFFLLWESRLCILLDITRGISLSLMTFERGIQELGFVSVFPRTSDLVRSRDLSGRRFRLSTWWIRLFSYSHDGIGLVASAVVQGCKTYFSGWLRTIHSPSAFVR